MQIITNSTGTAPHYSHQSNRLLGFQLSFLRLPQCISLFSYTCINPFPRFPALKYNMEVEVYAVDILCINCLNMIRVDLVERHSQVCFVVAPSILALENSSSLRLIDLKIDKLKCAMETIDSDTSKHLLSADLSLVSGLRSVGFLHKPQIWRHRIGACHFQEACRTDGRRGGRGQRTRRGKHLLVHSTPGQGRRRATQFGTVVGLDRQTCAGGR